MLISNVFTAPQSRQNDAPPPKEQSNGQPEADSNESAAPKNESAASNKTTAPQETARSESTAKSAPAQQLAASEPAKVSRADEEAFARAAAQRAVDSARTRALLDTIDPVENAGVKAAQSYLTPVEPKAPASEDAKPANTAQREPLDKAA